MNRIKELRLKNGIKQIDLAKRLKITQGNISAWENDRWQPDNEALKKLSDMFNVSIDYILGNDLLPENIYPVGMQIKIPILGKIRAGRPILAEEHIEGYEYADPRYAEECFFLRVEGKSMEPKIPEGSLVLFRKQSVAEEGQIIVCLVDGDCATLKRYKPQPNGIILLQADNPEAQSYTLTSKDFENGYAEILGVAIKVEIKL